MNGTPSPLALSLLLTVLTIAPSGCGPGAGESEDDLTSLTARERLITFEGFVYVQSGASDKQILAAVKAQTRSAFGALLTQNIAVASRELANVDPASFVEEPVDVVGPDGAVSGKALRVRYRYTDRAVVPKTMAQKSALRLGLLHGDYGAVSERVYVDCSTNTSEDREMGEDVWYVFNPSLAQCKKAMLAEQEAIDAARAAADAAPGEVVQAEIERLYLPMTAKLEPTSGPKSRRYPEYDRLWSGGVAPGKLVVKLVFGPIEHAAPGKKHHMVDDPGYWEMLDAMDVVLAGRPGLKVVGADPPTDLGTFTVGGKKVSGLDFADFIQMEMYETGFPSGFGAKDKLALRKLVAERLTHRWVHFEEKVKVKIGGAAPVPRTIALSVYFGAEEDVAPYRQAIRTSDVFVYNGHSYIGEGPLDPANFEAADFPESYQILFVDSCISFNYYNQDYFGFKARGSKDLDVISNGVESFSDGAGAGEGRFVVSLLGGKQPSYADLLKAAVTTGTGYAWGKDALRVVDGETDNVYQPAKKPIKLLAP
jgi:hypothetical protein